MLKELFKKSEDGKDKKKQIVDTMSAVYILQMYLDKK